MTVDQRHAVPLRAIVRCLTFALLCTAIGCTKPAGGPADKAAPEKVATVTVVKPERKTVRRVIEQPGHLEAFEETPLIARIPGYVQKVNVDKGDRVRGPRFDNNGKQIEAGQVLAELSVPELVEEHKQKQALVAQAEAEVEQAQGTLDAAEANIATTKALIREAEASRARAQATYERWESEYKRIEGLVQRKVIDDQTRDETRNQLKASDAARQEVEAKVQSAQAIARESEAKRNKARADLSAARARVQVAQAEEGRLAALVQYAKITAPYDGVVVRRNIHTGHFLQPSAGNAAQPVFVVARSDTVRVVAEVPEVDALWINDGIAARVRVLTIKDQEFSGKVTRTSWSLDPKARTLRTEVDLPNPQGKLRPGMYTYVTFTTEFPNRLTLPASAVAMQGDHAVCYQLEGGKLARTPLKVGLRDSQRVEVLKKQAKPATPGGEASWEDFTGNEAVVQGSLANLSDGQSAKVDSAAK